MDSGAADVERPDLVKMAGITSGFPAGFVPRCPFCRYDLTGLERSRCPECGALFSLSRLLAEWEARKRNVLRDTDFWIGAVLAWAAAVPVDMRSLVAFGVKAPLLAAMWTVSWIWWRRRREELRDAEHGHRLLWLWVPIASTCAAAWPTPMFNWIVWTVMGAAALCVMAVAWRRSPERTGVVVAVTLAVPAAVMLLMGGGLFLSAMVGRAHGYHWSAADYPSWYWQGVAGRSRGVGNPDAVWAGGATMVSGAVMLAVVLALWLLTVRNRFKERAVARQQIVIAPRGRRR